MTNNPNDLDKIFAENVSEPNFRPKADMVNKPPHYNRPGAMETIEEMELVFGTLKVQSYCIINAWKYRARAFSKGNPEEDMAKSDWYLKKAKELENKLNATYNGKEWKNASMPIYR